MIKITLKGEREPMKMVGKLPSALNKNSKEKIGEFARFVQKSAKLRAPKATGQLADSIRVDYGKRDVKIVVGARYGIYQEIGFRPHWIHRNMHTLGGYRVGDWMDAKGIPKNINFIYVRKNKPFIEPALTEGLKKFPEMMSKATKQAIKQAGG